MYGTPPEHGAPVWCSIVFPNPPSNHLRRRRELRPAVRQQSHLLRPISSIRSRSVASDREPRRPPSRLRPQQPVARPFQLDPTPQPADPSPSDAKARTSFTSHDPAPATASHARPPHHAPTSERRRATPLSISVFPTPHRTAPNDPDADPAAAPSTPQATTGSHASTHRQHGPELAGDSLLSPTTRTISTIRLLHPSRAVPQLPLSKVGQRSDARPPSPHPPATI
ncbi:hypothetical protein ACLOJK_036482 [Asimina triloba]